ncbi:hypothetical protein GRZ57_13380 [Sphaerochaeta halotolerans]|nr:hypothetical protein [Sphaerochaeta halotolerans]
MRRGPFSRRSLASTFLLRNERYKRMKGITTPGQAMDSGGVASFSAPRDGVSHLAFPALARE